MRPATTAGLAGGQQLLLGRRHAGQQRQASVLAQVHAYAEVDLVGAGVGAELLVEAQDRITRSHPHGSKEGHL
jgi:hypothetical protein